MCLYCEYVVFDLEFSGFVVDFEFFLIWILNFLGKKETQKIFFLKNIKPIAAFSTRLKAGL